MTDIHSKIRALADQAMDEALRIETWAYQLERSETYLATAKEYRELSAKLKEIAQ